jgi:hypothetical protein
MLFRNCSLERGDISDRAVFLLPTKQLLSKKRTVILNIGRLDGTTWILVKKVLLPFEPRKEVLLSRWCDSYKGQELSLSSPYLFFFS